MTHESQNGIDRSPLHLLHRASQSAEGIFQSRITGGVTPRQLAVLMVAGGNDGLSQTGLVERTGIDRSTAANIVRRLVRRGWLSRRRSSADARAYVLKLTGEGEQVLRGAAPSSARIDARVLSALPREAREPFLAALQAVVDALEGAALRRTARDATDTAARLEG
jgi:DNA-binding MarR family transcriptional regulator